MEKIMLFCVVSYLIIQSTSSGKLADSEDEDRSDVDVTDGLTLMERVLIFGGVALAVFVFFLAIIIAGRNIYSHGWQKGWTAAEHAGLSDHKSPK